MGKVVRLHDGLRALYPEAIVFAGVGTKALAREFDRLRALLGSPRLTGNTSALTIAVSPDGIVIWGEAPVLTLRFSQLAAMGVDDEAMDVTVVVAGSTSSFRIPLAVPTEAAHIADRVLVALAGRIA